MRNMRFLSLALTLGGIGYLNEISGLPASEPGLPMDFSEDGNKNEIRTDSSGRKYQRMKNGSLKRII